MEKKEIIQKISELNEKIEILFDPALGIFNNELADLLKEREEFFNMLEDMK